MGGFWFGGGYFGLYALTTSTVTARRLALRAARTTYHFIASRRLIREL